MVRNITPTRAAIGCVLLAWSLLGASRTACAEGVDIFKITASSSVIKESNLFKLPSAVNNIDDEQVFITGVGVQFSKDYSLQRIEINANLTDYRYVNMGNLNNTANNSSAAWRWRISPRLQGDLTFDRIETVNDFTDVRGSQQRNQRTNATTRLDAAYQVGGPWRLLLGASHSTQTNPLNQTAESDTTATGSNAGIRYVFRSGSQMSYVLKNADGNYGTSFSKAAALIDDSFTQVEHEFSMRWLVDGFTGASARATALNRKHPIYGQRDFSGITATADVNVRITGKTSAALGWSRELSSYQTGNSNYTQTDRFSVSAAWQATSRTSARISHELSLRDFLGAPVALPADFTPRTDTQRNSTIALDWRPFHNMTFTTSLQDARRVSTLSGLDFQSTSASLAAQFSY